MGRVRDGVVTASRAGLTVAAQSLSSVTNFVAAALALRAGDLADFGRFSIAFQVCQLVIVVAQGAVGDIVLIHASHDAGGDRAGRVRQGAAGAALVGGVGVGAVIALAALAAGGDLAVPLLLAAVGSPALAAQYTLRAQRFAAGDALGALWADVVWFAVLSGAAIGDLAGWWSPSANAYLAVWLVGAAVSGAPVLVAGLAGGVARLGEFWAVAGPQSVRLGGEAALARSVFVTSLVAAEVMLGSAAGGALAAAVLVLSPMSVVHAAVSAFFVPRWVARGGIHVPGVRRVLGLTGFVVVLTLAWVLVVLAADAVDLAPGPFDLTANGISTALYLATAARFVALAVWRGPLVALRVADAASASLLARAIGTVAQWVLPVVGFATVGLATGAAGLAVGAAIGAVAAWVYYLGLGSDRTDPHPAPDPPP